MKVVVCVGDVLEHPADVLISTANPWLNMSGGVNGAIAARCPEIQAELREYLSARGQVSVSPRTVVRTSAGTLPFAHIIHAVAIDAFYDSSIEIVRDTLTAAFDLAIALGGRSVSTPALATGYGHLTIDSFGQALAPLIVGDRFDFDILSVVVRSLENAQIAESLLAGGK
jgi:O-acetyl-ADP-ribose deacetylase (regulator of RNase III)